MPGQILGFHIGGSNKRHTGNTKTVNISAAQNTRRSQELTKVESAKKCKGPQCGAI